MVNSWLWILNELVNNIMLIKAFNLS